MKFKYLLSFLAITLLATTVYTSYAEASRGNPFRQSQKTRKTTQKMNKMCTKKCVGRGTFGKIMGTQLRDFCTKLTFDDFQSCKMNCFNEPKILDEKYPSNVCPEVPALPSKDQFGQRSSYDLGRDWEAQRQEMGKHTESTARSDVERGKLLGKQGKGAQLGEFIKRKAVSFFIDDIDCGKKVCQNPSRVCYSGEDVETDEVVKETRRMCVKYCKFSPEMKRTVHMEQGLGDEERVVRTMEQVCKVNPGFSADLIPTDAFKRLKSTSQTQERGTGFPPQTGRGYGQRPKQQQRQGRPNPRQARNLGQGVYEQGDHLRGSQAQRLPQGPRRGRPLPQTPPRGQRTR